MDIMKLVYRILLVSMFFAALSLTVNAEKYKYGDYKDTKSIKSTAAGCLDPSGFRFLHVNNVRARINTGGDMWWNLENISQYYIPAETSKTSVFSGSLWIGGLDINNQLKQIYEQQQLALEQNRPNPFNPNTTIHYGLTDGSKVRLEIFDVNGRRVTTLVNTRQAPDCQGIACGRASSGGPLALTASH